MSKQFTKLQREEILNRIDVREETIEDDPESASGIEQQDGALEVLRSKVKAGTMDFTEGERTWLLEEVENMESIGWDNMRSEGPERVNGYIGSMRNAAKKIEG